MVLTVVLPQLGRFLGFSGFSLHGTWNIPNPVGAATPDQHKAMTSTSEQGGQGKCCHCESERKIVISKPLIQKTAIVKEGFVGKLLGGFYFYERYTWGIS